MMEQADTFDLRRLREGFGADSGFTDAQLLAGLTVPAILDPSRRSIGPAADPTPAPYRTSRAAKMAA
jgi:hypothetical protein